MKSSIQIKRRTIKGYDRMVLDFNKSDVGVIEFLYRLLNKSSEALVLFNSQMATSQDLTSQIKKIKRFLKLRGYEYKLLKFQSDREENILQRIFQFGEKPIHYKIASVIEAKDYNEWVNIFETYQANLHIGLKVSEPIETVQEQYVGNFLDDSNRFNYYDIDIFASPQLGRISIFSQPLATVEQLIDELIKGGNK